MEFFGWVWYLLVNIAVFHIEPLSSETFLIVVIVRFWRKDGQSYGAIAFYLSKMLQEGYTTSDFARRYNLNEHQMSHLFDLISQPPSSGPMAA